MKLYEKHYMNVEQCLVYAMIISEIYDQFFHIVKGNINILIIFFKNPKFLSNTVNCSSWLKNSYLTLFTDKIFQVS